MIDFLKLEEYDSSKLNIVPFYKKTDTYNGISLNFGNMTSGYPIIVGGVEFCCVETAYICAFFSSNNEKSIEIQKLIQTSTNGMMCKRQYRKGEEYKVHGRTDFDGSLWHYHFMLALVWKKCTTHKEFANNLKRLPKDCIIVENEPNKGDTSLWGAKNNELQTLLNTEKKRIEKNFSILSDTDKKEKLNIYRRSIWNKVGVWKGYNAMGKILMECRDCLLNGTSPSIDTELLNSAEIYWFGKKIKF